ESRAAVCRRARLAKDECSLSKRLVLRVLEAVFECSPSEDFSLSLAMSRFHAEAFGLASLDLRWASLSECIRM
ncbi:hypothetical protein A2U01_0070638, partial [Trifolium medium]|nr:hypothetical protein [Trifolium medium]